MQLNPNFRNSNTDLPSRYSYEGGIRSSGEHALRIWNSSTSRMIDIGNKLLRLQKETQDQNLLARSKAKQRIALLDYEIEKLQVKLDQEFKGVRSELGTLEIFLRADISEHIEHAQFRSAPLKPTAPVEAQKNRDPLEKLSDRMDRSQRETSARLATLEQLVHGMISDRDRDRTYVANSALGETRS
jgi:hypothetical protein